MIWSNPRITGWRRWLAIFGSQFAWVRRFLGGHWERWWVEPCSAFLWLDVDYCSITKGDRPPACFGTPLCENAATPGPGTFFLFDPKALSKMQLQPTPTRTRQ